MLESDTDKAEVQQEIDNYRQMGVQSVPTLIVGKKYAVVGAQADATIAEVIEGVFQERQMANTETESPSAE